MSLYRLGEIRFFEISSILITQLEARVETRLLDSLLGIQPNDRTTTFLDRPRGGDAGHAHTVFLRNFLHTIHDRFIDLGLAGANHALQEIIRFLPQCRPLPPRSTEHTSRHRRPRNDSDPTRLAVRDHLALLLAIQKVVIILHGDEFMVSVRFGDPLQFLELPRRHGGCADVSHPSFLHHVVERSHDLFLRHGAVQAVDLQNVDVRPQTLGAGLHGVHDMFPAQADLIHHFTFVLARGSDCGLRAVVTHAEVAFREDHELGPRDGVFRDGFRDDALGFAVGIDVGRVYRKPFFISFSLSVRGTRSTGGVYPMC